MKIVLAFMLTLMASSSFARSYAYIDECREAGENKLRDQAEAMNIDLDSEKISIDGIDDHWYNPSKYIWFKGEGRDKDGKRAFVTTMVQKNTLSSKRCGEAEGYARSKVELDFIKECQTYATKMLSANMKAAGAIIDPKTVELDEVDARWYNPSKYAWFKAEGKASNGRRVTMSVMTQKSLLGNSSCKEHSSEAKRQGGNGASPAAARSGK